MFFEAFFFGPFDFLSKCHFAYNSHACGCFHLILRFLGLIVFKLNFSLAIYTSLLIITIVCWVSNFLPQIVENWFCQNFVTFGSYQVCFTFMFFLFLVPFTNYTVIYTNTNGAETNHTKLLSITWLSPSFKAKNQFVLFSSIHECLHFHSCVWANRYRNSHQIPMKSTSNFNSRTYLHPCMCIKEQLTYKLFGPSIEHEFFYLSQPNYCSGWS